MTRLLLVLVAVVLASGAGTAGAADRGTLTLRTSAYGKILFDGGGRALDAPHERDRSGDGFLCRPFG